jgi:hypothetical protein
MARKVEEIFPNKAKGPIWVDLPPKIYCKGVKLKLVIDHSNGSDLEGANAQKHYPQWEHFIQKGGQKYFW